MLYSTGKSTKRKADFWKGSKTYTVGPNIVWMIILKKWPASWYSKKKLKIGPCFPKKVLTLISPHFLIVHWFKNAIFWVWFSKNTQKSNDIMIFNLVVWKYLFWNTKRANIPALQFLTKRNVAFHLCNYFFYD